MNRIHASSPLSLALGVARHRTPRCGLHRRRRRHGAPGPSRRSGHEHRALPGRRPARPRRGDPVAHGRHRVRADASASATSCSVNFRLQKSDGSDWDIAELTSGRALVSGPTFNYQRVIAEQTDLLTASVKQADGSYTYTFASAIPATYLAPFNDTASFGPEDGELTGQALLEGTYTRGPHLRLGLHGRRRVRARRRQRHVSTSSSATGRGRAAPGGQDRELQPLPRPAARPRRPARGRHAVRAVPHLRRGGQQRPGGAGGTPGVSIDFRVMIHKIHAGEHLPSVLGRRDQPDGSRNYAAGADALRGRRLGHDFSARRFPAWPHGLIADAARPGLLGALRRPTRPPRTRSAPGRRTAPCATATRTATGR